MVLKVKEYNVIVTVDGRNFTKKFKATTETRAVELCRDMLYNDALDNGESEDVAIERSESAEIVAALIMN